MDVAFYAPLKPPDHPVPSGDRRMARLLMTAIERAGHRCTLVSRFRSYDGNGDVERQRRLKGLGDRLAGRLVKVWSRPGVSPPQAWFTYHLYHKAPDWLGPAICRAFGIPYFIAEASHAPKRAGGPWDLGHRGAAAAIGQAARIFCLNENDVACLRPLVAEPDRLSMLPPFLDTAPYRKAARDRTRYRMALAQHQRLNREKPWILVVAMMRPGDKLKSYEALGRSLSRLRGAPWQLLVAGGGPAAAEVELALAPLGRDRVRFLGAVEAEDLPALYAAADLMAWPAVNEAYGMAILEAQSSGLPVVSTRTGGVPGIVADGMTGILAPAADDDAFAASIRALLEDPARRAGFREAALAVTARRHDLDAAAACLKRGMTVKQ